MLRLFWFLLLFHGLTIAADGRDIATLANSPEELARFVNTNDDFDWGPLWKALKVRTYVAFTYDGELFLPPCESDSHGMAPCSGELIGVDPLQTVLVLEHKLSGFRVFLRYERSNDGAWQFSGAYEPFAKYFPLTHRLIHLGTKPFLIVTEQGAAGTGLSSMIESWFDLTRKNFEPALRFTSAVEYETYAKGIGRNTTGKVVAITAQPVDRVTVDYRVEFEGYGTDGDRIPVGSRRDRVVYTRTSSGIFDLDQKLSTVGSSEVKAFYDFSKADFDAVEFLKFNFRKLREIAGGNGGNPKSRAWLTEFLQSGIDTPEARQLRTLLTALRKIK